MTTETSPIAAAPESDNGIKETLTRDIKGIIGKADYMIRDAGNMVAEELSATRRAIAENACAATTATHAYVRAHPWKIIGIAAVAAGVIGAVISSRR